MTSKEFVDKAIALDNKNSIYGKGTFCNKYTKSFLTQKKKQYPEFYTDKKCKEIEEKAKKGELILADCVGLIKGIIWGYPDNGKYASNGLKDVSDQGLWDSYCANKSSDFNNITAGEIVHLKGHVGIYIGNGEVIEATTKWTGDILRSKLTDRKWTGHGKLTIISYEQTAPSYSIDYVVKRGDSMYSIAKAHNMTLTKLINLNPQVRFPSLIFPGQVLHIKK